MDWVFENWEHILALVGAVDLAATAIVKATWWTKKDDQVWAKVHRFLAFFAWGAGGRK